MSDSQDQPRNRKARRAAAKESGHPISPPTTTPKIKMVRPDYDAKNQSKTLLQIAEEKRHLLDQGQPFPKTTPTTNVRMDEGGNIFDVGLGENAEPIGPVGNAVFWAITLAMVHFTLDVLVYSQYQQAIVWRAIWTRTLIALPVLFTMVFLASSATAKRFALARQVGLLVMAIGSGCYTIHVANRREYFAVMKQTPPLGTLWVWSVVEMRLEFAAASVLLDLAFLWWKGYSVF